MYSLVKNVKTTDEDFRDKSNINTKYSQSMVKNILLFSTRFILQNEQNRRKNE